MRRETHSVDIRKTALFAECKWTNEKVGPDELEILIERSELFSYKNKFFFLSPILHVFYHRA